MMEKKDLNLQMPLFSEDPNGVEIRVTQNGPYIVYGKPRIVQQGIITNENGDAESYQQGCVFETESEPCALCRCGNSDNKPFCDCSHEKCDKPLDEVATAVPYLTQAEFTEGKHYVLSDLKSLCTFADFCGTHGLVWDLVKTATPGDDEVLLREVHSCPSGRIMVWEKETGACVEPNRVPELALLSKVKENISGPIRVTGGVKIISSQGLVYERRPRVSLCRCGESHNKPFCDGSHQDHAFCDGLPHDQTGVK